MPGPFEYPPVGAADVIIIGAGHSGLAMSHMLSKRSIDHVILERGEVANSWKTERWDSLRLLTPNWMTRLPGQEYLGDNPDGYMSAPEVGAFIDHYARARAGLVMPHTPVKAVHPTAEGYRVCTDRGEWLCRAVVLATGAFNIPVLPQLAEDVPSSVMQVSAQDYKNPNQLPDGGVLVVGASATGVQLAQEIQKSGRQVTLAVGEHVRMPRVYRGLDVQWWMMASGVLDQRIEEADDPLRARRVPSPQLIGSPDHATLDLNALQAEGVRVVGRLVRISNSRAQFSGSLNNVCALADLKMNRLLQTFDDWAQRCSMTDQVDAAERFEPTRLAPTDHRGLSIPEDIRAIVWATGFRPDYSWLNAPVFDRKGHLQHDNGIVNAPGLYVLGLPFLRRRKSSFIHGAQDDVTELSAHLAGFLHRTARRNNVVQLAG